MKPKALRAAIREKFPEVTKEAVRAAFYAITETSSPDQQGVAMILSAGSALYLCVTTHAGWRADGAGHRNG